MTGHGAKFTNVKFEVGTTDLGNKQFYYCFNWAEQPSDMTIKLIKRSKLTDYWTGKTIGVFDGDYIIKSLPGQSARLILSEPAN